MKSSVRLSSIANNFIQNQTAAHCLAGRLDLSFQIRAGSDMRSSGGQIINVTRIIMHPEYVGGIFFNDIAILKLQSSLQFGPRVWSIQIPAVGLSIPDGADLLVSGWGTLQSGGTSPEQLHKVYVPAVSNEDCALAYNNIRDFKLCAGIVGRDSCQG